MRKEGAKLAQECVEGEDAIEALIFSIGLHLAINRSD
jgi:hypothetical protein